MRCLSSPTLHFWLHGKKRTGLSLRTLPCPSAKPISIHSSLQQQTSKVKQQAAMASGWWQSLMDWLRSLFFSREMELSLIGLQNAGKTSLVNVLATGSTTDTIPTVGFNMRKVTKGGVTMRVWDLGGQTRFRSMWERYCRGVQAIVYVVDSADLDSLDAAKEELHTLLAKPSLAGIPLLVLGNKNDLPEALSANELISRLDLQAINDCETAVYSMSCKTQANLDVVLKWLQNHAKQ